MTWSTVRHTIGQRTRGLRTLARRATDRRPETINTGPAQGLRLPRRLASAHYAESPNELPVQEAVAQALRPGDVFFDVGANVGLFSLIASRIVGPTGTVIAFEPIPEIAGQLEANASINSLRNIQVLQIAVADRDGEMRLQTTAHPGGATLEGFGVPYDRTGTISVQTRTVDSLIAEGAIPPPNVVKIDVEGAEAAVLRGMPNVLASGRPTFVFELDAADDEELRSKRLEVESIFASAGFESSELPLSYGGNHLVRHFVARPVVGLQE